MTAASPDRDGGDDRLATLIRDEILDSPGRRITFARFMEMALTEPELGYYVTSDGRPTRDGDFLTAPELHPFFGRCIGRLLTSLWARLGSPDRFVIQEWGAGRGTLGLTTLDGLVEDASALSRTIDWRPVDVPGRYPAVSKTRFVGAIVANEYLDALPVHRLVRRGDRILERYVTCTDDGYAEIEGALSDPMLTAPLDAAGVTLADDQVAEVRPAAAAWLRDVTDQLERGVVLIIDYGYPAMELYGPRRMAGTLVTYRDHVAGDDPFVRIGCQDMTAHVDISALERAASQIGLDRLGSTTQARLLADLGLGDLLSVLGRDPTTSADAYLAARASVVRMLDPRHLGGFRVLMFGRGVTGEPPIAGFRPLPSQVG